MYFKRSENEASFIGRIGKDVEVTEGSKSTRFSIATNAVFGKDESKKEKTIWVPIEVWNDEPTLPYLKQGMLIRVKAYYDTSESGEGENKKYYHVFKATNILLLDSRDNVNES